MKKLFILLIMLVFTTSVFAQRMEMSREKLMPGLSYSQVKYLYSPAMYDTFMGIEKVNPTIAGVASFFIPGLGQILAGEVGRGLAFFGCSLLFSWTLIVPIVVWIYSIVDAVKVAKVMNMYHADLLKARGFTNISLQSYGDQLAFNTTAPKFQGLSLNFRF